MISSAIAAAIALALFWDARKRATRVQEWVLPASVTVFGVALWSFACWATGTEVFPTPFETVQAFGELIESKRLWGDVAASLFRVTWGFLIAAGIGIPLGLVVGWSTRTFRALNPIIQLLKPISPLAWMPLLLYSVQNPTWTAILVVFMAALWPTVANTAFGVNSIRRACSGPSFQRLLW